MSGEQSMIERVARAIYYGKARNKRWELLQPEFQRQYEKQARAAIEAMRTPTREMLEAGATGCGEDSTATAEGAWESMIDAALSEG